MLRNNEASTTGVQPVSLLTHCVAHNPDFREPRRQRADLHPHWEESWELPGEAPKER
jgi:hypothetical protein